VSSRLHNAMSKGDAWYLGRFPMSDDQLPPAMTGCLDFDGVAAYIDISTVAPVVFSGAVSWGVWAKKDGVPVVAREMILAINSAAGGNTLLHRIEGGATTASFFAGSSVTGTTHQTTSCVDDEWHHHCVTWDIGGSDRLLYYLDGVLQFTSNVFTSALGVGDTWSIGMEYDAAVTGDFFNGRIARATIFPRTLTAAEVASLHSSPLPTTPTGLGAIAVYAPGTHAYSLRTVSDETGNTLTGIASGIDGSDFVEDSP
jgi:hypothetical protein